VSNALAGVGKWEVLTVGSDHYPVSCLIGEKVEVRPGGGIPRWIFQKAKWEEFQTLSDGTMTKIDMDLEI